MGYTHYFPQQRDFSTHEWSMITKAFMKLHKNLMFIEFEKVFAADYCKMFSTTANGGEPILIEPEYSCGWTDFFTHSHSSKSGKNAVCFNGVGELSHDTFIIERAPKEKPFAFCKTNGKPYDLMVTSMLIVCAGYAEGALQISSDGDAEDWVQAVKFVSGVLGKATKVNFNEEGHLVVSSPTPEEIQEMEQETIFNEVFNTKKKQVKTKPELKIVHTESP